MLDAIFDPAIIASFLSLAALEIVLGIDNVVFLSLVVSRLPAEQRKRARQIGLGLALGMRIIMLFGITWIIQLTTPILTIYEYDLSWKDLILLAGGLFLLAKGTHEIHRGIEGAHDEPGAMTAAGSSFTSVILQIVAIDLVFSIDSIITAIGMTDIVWVMIAAVMVAIAVMYFASEAVSRFIEHHPTTKMLALSFLLLIGVALIADGLHFHIPRGYIYFAMAFSAFVEIFNVISQRRRKKARAAHN